MSIPAPMPAICAISSHSAASPNSISRPIGTAGNDDEDPDD